MASCSESFLQKDWFRQPAVYVHCVEKERGLPDLADSSAPEEHHVDGRGDEGILGEV